MSKLSQDMGRYRAKCVDNNSLPMPDHLWKDAFEVTHGRIQVAHNQSLYALTDVPCMHVWVHEEGEHLAMSPASASSMGAA